jgi:hypothetical protein
MTIFVFTAVIMLIFFPLIYFMWSSFISMLYWQWKIRKMTDEEREQLMMGPLQQERERLIPRQAKLMRVHTGLFNFVTADEFIADLSKPDLPARQLRKILQELSTCKGMIKQQQQEKLHSLLSAFQERRWQAEDEDLKTLIQEALIKLDEAKIID